MSEKEHPAATPPEDVQGDPPEQIRPARRGFLTGIAALGAARAGRAGWLLQR